MSNKHHTKNRFDSRDNLDDDGYYKAKRQKSPEIRRPTRNWTKAWIDYEDKRSIEEDNLEAVEYWESENILK